MNQTEENKFDLHEIMRELAVERPLFHSEKDFQLALAWLFQRKFPSATVRLERRLSLPDQTGKVYIDVWLSQEARNLALELKYCTRKFRCQERDDIFELLDQSAQDQRRYKFLRDLKRLEAVLAHTPNTDGAAILLTNDSSFWREGKADRLTVDAAFRVHHGRTIQGSLGWSDKASPGTMKGCEIEIVLSGKYQLCWNDYSEVKSSSRQNSAFRYLLVHPGT